MCVMSVQLIRSASQKVPGSIPGLAMGLNISKGDLLSPHHLWTGTYM